MTDRPCGRLGIGCLVAAAVALAPVASAKDQPVGGCGVAGIAGEIVLRIPSDGDASKQPITADLAFGVDGSFRILEVGGAGLDLNGDVDQRGKKGRKLRLFPDPTTQADLRGYVDTQIDALLPCVNVEGVTLSKVGVKAKLRKADLNELVSLRYDADVKALGVAMDGPGCPAVDPMSPKRIEEKGNLRIEFDTLGALSSLDGPLAGLVEEPECVAAPLAGGDDFDAATVLETAVLPDEATQIEYGENVCTIDATAEVGEPDHAGRMAARSIWFTWTATGRESENVKVLADSDTFDPVVAVYTGSAVDALQEVAANDDREPDKIGSSKATFAPVAGTEYFIAVDGFGDACLDAREGDVFVRVKAPVGAIPAP